MRPINLVVCLAVGGLVTWVNLPLARAQNTTCPPYSGEPSCVESYPLQAAAVPWGFVVDSQKNLWFAQSGTNKFGKITLPPTGQVEITEVDAPGGPIEIALGADKALWYTEAGAYRIGRMDPKTNKVDHYPIPDRPVPPDLSYPFAIAAGPDRNLWFAEEQGRYIGKVDLQGSITKIAIPGPATEILDVAFAADGKLWIAQTTSRKILTFDPHNLTFGRPIRMNHNGFPVEPVALAAKGNEMWVALAQGRIAQIPIGGSPTYREVGDEPTYIALAKDGTLWVTLDNTSDARAIQISPTGAVLSTAQLTTGSDPRQIIQGPDGNIWIGETNTSKLRRIILSGAAATTLTPNPGPNAGGTFDTETLTVSPGSPVTANSPFQAPGSALVSHPGQQGVSVGAAAVETFPDAAPEYQMTGRGQPAKDQSAGSFILLVPAFLALWAFCCWRGLGLSSRRDSEAVGIAG